LTYVIRRLLYGSAVLFAASTLVFWGLSLVTSPIGLLRMQPILSGAVVTETIFALPGVGRLVVTSISQRDYPIIQGAVLMIAVVFVAINLVVDLLYAWFDPRISYA
jgi:peptide/nickel transport system permease protein